MSEEWEKYVADTRPICKYGVKCYQKNPQHHNQYKHPPQNTKRKKYNQDSNVKRFKPQDSTTKDDKLLTNTEATNEQDLKCSPKKTETQNVNKNMNVEKLRKKGKDLTFYFKRKDSSTNKDTHVNVESTSQQNLGKFPLKTETQNVNDNSDVEKALKKIDVTKELTVYDDTVDISAASTSQLDQRKSPLKTETQSVNDNLDVQKATKKLDATKELKVYDDSVDISADSAEDTSQKDLTKSPLKTETQSINDKSDVEKAIKKLVMAKELTFYDNTVDTEELLNRLFLTRMPLDFYKFYECLKEDGSVEDILARVKLQLIGPYDLLLGKLPIVNDEELYLVHWRFFYDPPEFQTVLKVKGNSQLHYGYFRDNPDDKPEFMASNDSAKDCILTPVADNIFGAVYLYLESEKKRSPFISIASQKLMEKIKKWAETHKFSLKPYNARIRTAKAVTRTFHGAGIMVPYDKKTQIGYRPLVETNDTIKKLFARLRNVESQTAKDKVLSELQPVITYASIAMDEGDFGTTLEIGINLFCSGIKSLEASALGSLTSAYSLLDRKAYVEIIKAHLKYRRKGPDLSLLSLNDS